MSQPMDPQPDAPEVTGPPPSRRVISIEIDLDRLPSAGTAFGVSLLGAAIVMAAMYARMHDGLDSSTFIVGVLAVLGLLAISAAVQLARIPALEKRAALMSWPGAFGAAGAGILLAVLINSEHPSIYLGAGFTLVLSAAGYVLSRSGPFVVSSIAALAILYIEACSDVLDFGNGQNALMIAGAAALVFIIAVTGLGWFLPETRVLSAMVVGVGGLYVITSGLGPFFLFGLLTSPAGGDYGEPGSRHNPYENDIWMLLLYCLVLVVLWGLCSLATGFVGFRILIAVLALFAVPLASLGLAINHPTWWEVVLTAAGGALLVAAGLQSVNSRR